MSNKSSNKKNINQFEGLTPEECGLEDIDPVSELQTDMYLTIRNGLPKSLLVMLYMHLVENGGKVLINNHLYKGHEIIGLEPEGKPIDDMGHLLFKGIKLTDSNDDNYWLDLEHTKVLDAENQNGLYTFDIGIITGNVKNTKFLKVTMINPV